MTSVFNFLMQATVRFEKVEDAEKVKSQKNVMVNGVEVTVEKVRSCLVFQPPTFLQTQNQQYLSIINLCSFLEGL